MDNLMQKLKVQVIERLNLKDLKPSDIGDDQPLFVEGIGLDSIDALELIVLLQQEYKIKLSNAEDGPKVFKSVSTMADYILQHQAQKAYMSNAVFIVGTGVISAIGNNVAENLHALETGTAGMAALTL